MSFTSRIMVELWGLDDDLLLCFQLNFSTIEIELDSKVVICLMKSSEEHLRDYALFVDD